MFRQLDFSLYSTLSKHQPSGPPRPTVRVLFGSQLGNTQTEAVRFAAELQSSLGSAYDVTVGCVSAVQFEQASQWEVLVLFLATHTDGVPPPKAALFCRDLEDAVFDFRYDRAFLSALRFCVVGFGSSEYGANFCRCAIDVDAQLTKLGATRLAGLVKCCDTREHAALLLALRHSLTEALAVEGRGGEDTVEPKNLEADDEEEEEEEESEAEEAGEEGGEGEGGACGSDMEDLEGAGKKEAEQLPEMVTKRQRQQLTKEGYKLIGSHSAVKLCRWTKHQLRGRGGCYKHTFYGITSYQCMEVTPSLACANKCVFCWRHHKNPVGTSWKWRMEAPDFIVNEAVERHVKMIHELKGTHFGTVR